MDSIYFSFDGIKNEDMGVYPIRTESGMVTEFFMAERSIQMEQIAGNPIPYVYGITESPFTLKMTLGKLGNDIWTIEERRKIARWLGVKKFAEFYSTDDVNKIYFLTYTGGIDITTNGASQGYITVEFQSVSPYMYSPIIKKAYRLTTNTSVLEIYNEGDTTLYPDELYIKKVGNGDLSIVNTMDGGREFKFANLVDSEELTINNKLRDIQTNRPTPRYDSFNRNYLRLVTGLNVLEITGKCDIALRYRYERLT